MTHPQAAGNAINNAMTSEKSEVPKESIKGKVQFMIKQHLFEKCQFNCPIKASTVPNTVKNNNIKGSSANFKLRLYLTGKKPSSVKYFTPSVWKKSNSCLASVGCAEDESNAKVTFSCGCLVGLARFLLYLVLSMHQNDQQLPHPHHHSIDTSSTVLR